MRLHEFRQTKKRDAIFKDADSFLEEARAYFDYIDMFSLTKQELVKYMGDATKANLDVGRPYSQHGLCAYLNVSLSYFRSRKSLIREKVEGGTATEADKDLNEAIEYVETVITAQQLEGAAVGIFNANIVARLNGLGDGPQAGQSTGTIINITTRDQATTDNLNKLTQLL